MWLTICSGPDQGRTLEFRSGSLEIGRDPTCDLCLVDTAVSRRHAVLMLDGPDSGEVRDEGSHNGTYVNDVRLLGAVAVRGVERIRVGGTEIQLTPSRAQPAALAGNGATPSGSTASPAFGIEAGAQVGVAAAGDVVQQGHYVAGGNQYIHNQQLIRWRQMRRNAHRLLVFSIFLVLAGIGLFGSWIIRWDTTLFGSANSRSEQVPKLPSPMPWIPLGAFLVFAGIVLLITALVMRRVKEPVPTQ